MPLRPITPGVEIEVSSCNCTEKSYRHVHCPCLRCQGKATTRSTELRHWTESRLWSEGASSSTTFEFGCDSGDGSDDELTIMDFDAEESFSEEQPGGDIMVEQESVSVNQKIWMFLKNQSQRKTIMSIP